VKVLWEGRYLDGKTSASQKVVVRPLKDGLRISLEDGTDLIWPYDGIRQVQGHFEGEPVRLERGEDRPEALPETLTIADTEFLHTLRAKSAAQSGRFHNPGFRRTRFWLVVQAGLASLAVAFVFYRWGIPFIAEKIAQKVPISWEEGLGEQALAILAPPGFQVHNPRLDAAIERIVARVESGFPNCPYHFKVIVSNFPHDPNAMALPGGNIVVFVNFLKWTRSPEELAGVLAHEMTHVLKRHITKQIIQDSSSGLLVSLLSGDATGSMAFGIKGTQSLAELAYSRRDEEEADREGMKAILASGTDPQGMIRFFDTLQKKIGGKESQFDKYLSTHPLTGDRVKKLKELVASAEKPGSGIKKRSVKKLLPDTDWPALVKSAGNPKKLSPEDWKSYLESTIKGHPSRRKP